MDELMDFDKYEISTRRYRGTDKKDFLYIDNQYYMLKFNEKIKSGKGMYESAKSSVYSEYISCHIIETLDISVQETYLGIRNGKIAVACKDFCGNDSVLNEFELYQNLDSVSAYDRNISFANVFRILKNDPTIDFEKAREQIWDMFVIDALLGNFDRHVGNWGYLSINETNKLVNAPIYDCGSCLYPMIKDEIIEKVISDKNEIKTRIYDYPSSAFIDDNGKKINYYDFLTKADDEYLIKSIKKIVPRVDMTKIYDIINNTPTLSEIRKRFYITMLGNRKEIILDNALRNVMNK